MGPRAVTPSTRAPARVARRHDAMRAYARHIVRSWLRDRS